MQGHILAGLGYFAMHNISTSFSLAVLAGRINAVVGERKQILSGGRAQKFSKIEVVPATRCAYCPEPLEELPEKASEWRNKWFSGT